MAMNYSSCLRIHAVRDPWSEISLASKTLTSSGIPTPLLLPPTSPLSIPCIHESPTWIVLLKPTVHYLTTSNSRSPSSSATPLPWRAADASYNFGQNLGFFSSPSVLSTSHGLKRQWIDILSIHVSTRSAPPLYFPPSSSLSQIPYHTSDSSFSPGTLSHTPIQYPAVRLSCRPSCNL